MSYANLICYAQFIWYFIWDVALDFLAFLYSIRLMNAEDMFVYLWTYICHYLRTYYNRPFGWPPTFCPEFLSGIFSAKLLSLGGNMLPWIRVVIEGKHWCLVAKAISGLWSFDLPLFFQKEKWSLFAFFNRTSLWVVNQRFHVAMFRRG